MATSRIREACSPSGVSTNTLRRWAEDGQIAPVTHASGQLAADGVALAKLAQELAGPLRMVSLLSREAGDELGLEPGMLVAAAAKSTNVSVEIPNSRPARPSAPIGEARRAG